VWTTHKRKGQEKDVRAVPTQAHLLGEPNRLNPRAYVRRKQYASDRVCTQHPINSSPPQPQPQPDRPRPTPARRRRARASHPDERRGARQLAFARASHLLNSSKPIASPSTSVVLMVAPVVAPTSHPGRSSYISLPRFPPLPDKHIPTPTNRRPPATPSSSINPPTHARTLAGGRTPAPPRTPP
jgi:hypothetical protein